MKNDTDRVIQFMGLSEVDTLLEKRTCTADSCDGAAERLGFNRTGAVGARGAPSIQASHTPVATLSYL